MKDNETLFDQGVKYGTLLMVIIINNNSDLSNHKDVMLLDSTKADVKLLAESKDEENYFQVSNF